MARFASVLAAASIAAGLLSAPAASADTTVWNFNVFGPPRAITAAIEAMSEFYKKESNGSSRYKDSLWSALWVRSDRRRSPSNPAATRAA